MTTMKKTFGFKSIKFPPTVLSDLSDTNKLSDFESELTLKINNIEYRNINNWFKKKSTMTSMRLKLVIKYLSLQISIEICTN